MNVILGGTGQVGSAAARALLARGEPVTIVTRTAAHGSDLKQRGAGVAVTDVRDTDALRRVLDTGSRAFLLNPNAAPSGDTDAEERATAASIVAAVNRTGLEKIVVASTYGARPGERCGDLTVLHEFEQMLSALSVPVAVNRGAYYMSNWVSMLELVRARGTLPSFFPPEFALPMVAPDDLGEWAARRLLTPTSDMGVCHIEGPQRYTSRDVADAFSEVLGRDVGVATVPRDAWRETFEQLGFSRAAAESYTCMTSAVVDDQAAWPDTPERGATSLRAYIRREIEAAR